MTSDSFEKMSAKLHLQFFVQRQLSRIDWIKFKFFKILKLINRVEIISDYIENMPSKLCLQFCV